jgi:uncharacterized protein
MMNAIIIFQKNPELGKVKTRLAATVGDENALKIYAILVEHTHSVISTIQAKKYLFFSNFIENDEKWAKYEKKVQKGEDLGLRMYNAIREVKDLGADRIVVLGTDCFELSSDILEKAFDELTENDYCIGPAEDGGYYLIGTREPDAEVFLGKEWSTATVFAEAQRNIAKINKSLAVLPVLSDVDNEEDLKTLKAHLV